MQVRKRKDLQIFPRTSGLDSKWVVKDPVAFNHFLFSAEDLFLLNLFDGRRPLEQVRTEWQSKFRTRSLTESQLQGMVEQFVRDNLVVVDRFGYGMRLHQDERRARRSQWLAKMSSPLVIKLGGFDPREILDLLWIPGSLLFNKFVIFMNLLVAALVSCYFVGQFEEIALRVNSMTGFFTAKNFLVMTIVIVVVKVFHEFGHALACRKYGGECFEIGVLLLAFFPTLYCDVTDSWTFPDRWKRIMVSFAGIYVEIILATISATLWLTTSPGLANSLFFNIVVMCSINTLFINGNPLLRYDGYYILSDLFEKPNLSQAARQSVGNTLCGLFLDETFPVEKNTGVTIFGFLSMLYRWFVMGSIAIGLYLFLKSINFGLLSEVVVAALLTNIGFRMFKQSSLGLKSSHRRKINWPRSIFVSCLLILTVAFCFYMPIPTFVYCTFVVEPADAAVVYASRKGKLELQVSPYDPVVQGQVLGHVVDLKLQEDRRQTIKRLENLKERTKRMARRFEQNPENAAETRVLKNEIQKVQAQLVVLEKEAGDLTLTSSASGMIRPLTTEQVYAEYENAASQLTSGTFLDAANKNIFVRRGQPLLVVEGRNKMLVSYMGENDVEFLEPHQSVVIRFHQLAGTTFVGEVKEVIQTDVQLRQTDEDLSGLETYVDKTGQTKTRQTPYRVIISIDELSDQVLTGSRGRARVQVPSRTLASKVWFVLERWWKEQNF